LAGRSADRFAGFSEVGDRGAEAKYGKETGRRILALLDAAPPKGYANWTGPLIAKALLDVHVQFWMQQNEPVKGGGRTMLSQIVIEAETPGDSQTMFRLLIDANLIAWNLTAAQAQLLVAEILERIAFRGLERQSSG
jgi:hypothetical protein